VSHVQDGLERVGERLSRGEADRREADRTCHLPERPSERDIGLLFHDTAEQAANEETVNRADWYEICERPTSQRRADDALEPVDRIPIGC
jgi:hypothetical protein